MGATSYVCVVCVCVCVCVGGWGVVTYNVDLMGGTSYGDSYSKYMFNGCHFILGYIYSTCIFNGEHFILGIVTQKVH